MRFLKIRLDAHALDPGPYDQTHIDLLWTLRAQTDSPDDVSGRRRCHPHSRIAEPTITEWKHITGFRK